PDLYQGDELWNFTLVDPDNRRDVDYDARVAALGELDALGDKLSRGDAVDPFDSRLKLFITHELLELRRREPAAFIDGGYLPLDVRGPRARNVFASANASTRPARDLGCESTRHAGLVRATGTKHSATVSNELCSIANYRRLLLDGDRARSRDPNV